MRQIAVTGSSSGIGAAIRARLEADNAKVIGVDLHDAEVITDLSRPDGRSAAAAEIRAASDARLDGTRGIETPRRHIELIRRRLRTAEQDCRARRGSQ